MPQCTRCQTETELYENGSPICITCADRGTEPKPKPLSPTTLPQLRDSLFQALIRATARANAAAKALNAVTKQFQTGRANGILLIRQASEDLEAARKELGRAHNRLNDFLSRGIVTDDLKRAAGQ
jgi:hypothetical protein